MRAHVSQCYLYCLLSFADESEGRAEAKKAKPRAKARLAGTKKAATKKKSSQKAASKPSSKAAKKATAAAPKAKKQPAKQPTKASKKAAAKPAAKKRKVRTQEDKILENTPVDKPFYVETGSEWHATDIGTCMSMRLFSLVVPVLHSA